MEYKETMKIPTILRPSDSSTLTPSVAAASVKILSSSRKRKMQGPQDSGMRRRKRPKGAKLQRILELPEDIFDVIAEFLHPAALISLSRVSRTFRAHLSSDILWTNCRKRAGLPDLEANDITDRQYIHLLFDTHCHDCGQPNIRNLDLLSCSRLCQRCRIACQHHCRDVLPIYHPAAHTCAKDLQAACWPLKSGQWFNEHRGISKLSQKLYTMEGAELEEFIQARITLKGQILRDSKLIGSWLHNQEIQKRDENSQLERAQVHARLEAIKLRLIEIGWTSEMLTALPLLRCKDLFIAKRLTNKGWNDLKEPLLRAHRYYLKCQARSRQLPKAYDWYLERDQDKVLFPSYRTFCSFDAMESVVNDPHTMSGHDLETLGRFDSSFWEAAYPIIASSIQEYKSAVVDRARFLLALAYDRASLSLPPHSDIFADPRSLFRVSTNLFRAGYPIDQVLQFPQIHEVMRDRQDVGKWGETGEVWRRSGVASEFLNGDEKLRVDLDVWKEIGEERRNWVLSRE